MEPNASKIQPRAMTVGERRAFQAAGLDLRRRSTEIKQLEAAKDYSGIVLMNDEKEDWILTNIYPDLPADMSNPEATALAEATFNLTFGMAETERKNSSTSTSGAAETDLPTA